MLTGWTRLDPLVSLAVGAIIVVGTWRLLRDSISVSLDPAPVGVNPDEVSAFLLQQSGVAAIHDLHIWSLSTTETALTCRYLMPAGHPGDEFLVQLAQHLQVHAPGARHPVRGTRCNARGSRSCVVSKQPQRACVDQP